MRPSSGFDVDFNCDRNSHDESAHKVVEDQDFGEEDVGQYDSEYLATGGCHDGDYSAKFLDDCCNKGEGEEGEDSIEQEWHVDGWDGLAIGDGSEDVA